MEQINAPWTPDQVDSLNAYQRGGLFHEYTWGEHQTLIATPEGWRTAPGEPVYQNWAHGFTANWSWLATHLEACIVMLLLRERPHRLWLSGTRTGTISPP